MTLRSTQLLRTPATHSFSYTQSLDKLWAYLSDTISACVSVLPTARIARTGVLK